MEQDHEQKSSATMASLLSPVIAIILMKAFEKETIESSELEPTCWYSYVHDTLWLHARETLHDFPLHLNKQHACINFTMEM